MATQIGTFLEFLLDTETTSEISFNEAISKPNQFFEKRSRANFEQLVKQKLQSWSDCYQKEQRAIADRIAINAGVETSDHESETDEESSSENEEKNKTSSITNQISQSIKQPEMYIDPVSQCKRLLQLLYHCQGEHPHLVDLYYRTLDQCIKSENEKLGAVGLQQIALHLSNDDKNRQRLIGYIPRSSRIPESYKAILSTIDILLSTQPDQSKVLSSRDFDNLYPQTARFLDLRREFRDSTHYFIDGDSLILSIAHHINIDLHSYFGNTLHVTFIVERILLTLFNQAHHCNYTLLFFDCHYRIYREEKSIFDLLRACLIAHLRRNADPHRSPKIQQFPSWLDEDYRQFTSKEKPHFIFYHDISSLHLRQNSLLTGKTLQKLVYMYRLFGNYHEHYLQCHLYLMNKLILTDTTVQCFGVRFLKKCSEVLFRKAIAVVPVHRKNMEDEWIEWEKKISEGINQTDVRLLVYLKTMIQLNGEDLLQFLGPLLILHVALLIRLSLIDRHLPSNFPSIEFSSKLSHLIIRFQKQLAWNLSSCTSNLLWEKIADIFDGRLFAFTLYRLHQSSPSKTSFDVNTMEIVQQCLTFLKYPEKENILSDSVKQLIQSKDIIIVSSTTVTDSMLVREQKIARISNPLIDTLLKPILSRTDQRTFEFINPDQMTRSTRYEGKYHWHVYKEVGDEVSRIRDNDEESRKPTNYRYRTKNEQRFYTYFTLYGNSLTSRDVRDNHLQIVLPTAPRTNEAAAAAAVRSHSASEDGKKPKRKGQSKQVPQKKADKIREEHRQEKLEKRVEDEAEQITYVEDRLKEIPMDDHARAIDFIDQGLSKFETSANRLKLLKRKFRLQRNYLELLRKKDDLTTEEKSKLDLLQVGYFATMTEMAHLEEIVDMFDQKTKYMEELVDQSPLDHESWYRFQLEKINSRLPRREQGVPDSRVLDFIPDQWQVDFLDAVDKQQSIIIVAPTASGKTYASYYAMNKVLKDPHDSHGICVYVAPTKALVNQVAATIHSKFGAVFGIFTRDYRKNMNNCRILVTVPQCMQILLLSSNHQRWCQRIKYAIFDEIHCMSGEGGSDVWEKTILLINCPIIGLSATVNNGEELCQWIEHVEYDLSFIVNVWLI